MPNSSLTNAITECSQHSTYYLPFSRDNSKLLRPPNHRTNSTVRSLVRYWQRYGTIPIGIYVMRSKDRDQGPDARKSHSSP